jgi:lysophospholipase L1-like esterase
MKLVCFGDSWTAGHGVETDYAYKKIGGGNYVIDNWRLQNSWPRWVADKLNIEYINMGICGVGNNYILNNPLKDVVFNGNYLKEDDIIIVMFSYPYRNATNPINDYVEYEKMLKNYKHFYFNSFYPMFKDEIEIDLNLKNFIEPNNTMLDELHRYQKETGINPWNYNINIESFDDMQIQLGEYHPNINGYKKIAEIIYNKIKNKL